METKSLVTYARSGAIKRNRTVVSTFLVYQTGTGDNGITEFRNVRSVDGKPVEDAEQRAQTFVNEIAKASASGKELSRIEKEGARFDNGLTVNGMTLFQAPVLADNLRPYFSFNLDATESVDGRQAYAISYRQTRESPFVTTESRSAPNDGNTVMVYELGIGGKKAASLRVNGKFWVDSTTYQIVKEMRTLTTSRDDNPESTPIAETVLEYQPSDFSILTPKHISFTKFRLNTASDSPPMKEEAVILDYGKFSKAKVEVKVVEVND